MIIAQSTRLTIRHFAPEEEGVFIEILSDKRLTDYLPKRTPDDNRIIFSDTLKDYQNGNRFTRWAIFNNADDEFIGFAMLKATEGEPEKAEMGYVIHHKFKGQGIATEVAEALLNYGFNEQHLSQIFAVTDQANIASQRVLLKAGFKQGDNILRNDAWLSYFSIKGEDWLSTKS
ncbi:ribosomal-protein-alanine N-acetyltransferase [Mucilaginibacter gracilis]|uniref:Ribosomal-protein-alanine N-acetyltransferase n=1 Tax=Mucilaginibacter gracilis TaxID=423350 RepID=A0A495IXI3_9SPHI|nr:GNAT family N-acetyltransferase [Mucilaginibacter gracilis]RKR81282.1 ribosomal-protein-alanine N-acetyltransferase [Mucilaginibacter gracilis]